MFSNKPHLYVPAGHGTVEARWTRADLIHGHALLIAEVARWTGQALCQVTCTRYIVVGVQWAGCPCLIEGAVPARTTLDGHHHTYGALIAWWAVVTLSHGGCTLLVDHTTQGAGLGGRCT